MGLSLDLDPPFGEMNSDFKLGSGKESSELECFASIDVNFCFLEDPASDGLLCVRLLGERFLDFAIVVERGQRKKI